MASTLSQPERLQSRRGQSGSRASERRPPIEGLSPIRVAWLGIALYLTIFVVAPVTIVTPQALTPYLYIAFCYFAFFCGCILAQGPGKRAFRASGPDASLSDQQLLRFHNFVTVIATLGAMLKCIDVFVVRGVSLAGSVFDRRNELDTVGANPVSIVAAVLLPACLLVPFTYQLLRERGLATRFQRISSHALFLVPIMAGVLITGGRSAILIYASIYGLYLAYFGRLRVRGKTVALLLVVLIVLVAITTAIFNSRLEAQHMNALDSVYTSGYAFTLQPQTWITQLMQASPGPIGDMAFAVLLTCQYYLHGVFEFVYQYQNAPPFHIWGAASFDAYYKFFALVMSWPGPEELWNAVSVRTGIYTTFFGPVFSDFGWFACFYMLALGALAQRLWQRCRESDFGAVPFYMYLVYAIFFFPVFNSVTNADGLYNLTACALFFWLFPRRRGSARRA